MSPPVVVLNRDYVHIPKNCPLVSIMQNTCSFNPDSGEFDCVPVPRVYRSCDTPKGKQNFEVSNEIDPDIKKALKSMCEMSKS